MRKIYLIVPFLILFAGSARAEISCDDDLVKSTYSKTFADSLNWALASSVSEQQYNEINQDANGSAVIYGVPMGASYKDFQQSLANYQQSDSIELSHNETENVLWTGLDPTGSKDYEKCLDAYIHDSAGLHLAVKYAAQNDVALVLTWVPRGAYSHITEHIRWSEPIIGGKHLPTEITAGDLVIVIPRPKKEMILAVSLPGFGDTVILEPLPAPPPPPQISVVSSCGIINPNISVTAWSDVDPTQGFPPKTSGENQWVFVPPNNVANFAKYDEDYFYNGGGAMHGKVDTSCQQPIYMSPFLLDQTVNITSQLQGQSGDPQGSGWSPGGTGSINPSWQVTITLPGDAAKDVWSLNVFTSITSNFPQRSCQVMNNGTIRSVGLSNNVINNFWPLKPGPDIVKVWCSSPDQYSLRGEPVETPGQIDESITIHLSATRPYPVNLGTAGATKE